MKWLAPMRALRVWTGGRSSTSRGQGSEDLRVFSFGGPIYTDYRSIGGLGRYAEVRHSLSLWSDIPSEP